MKTLDEVIAYFDYQTQQRHVYLTEDAEVIYNDALHYLKEYQRYQNTPSRNGHMALVDYFDESQKNEPLTWSELKQMEGRPVWVEALLYKQWAVIGYVGENYIRFEGANLYAPESRTYMGAEDGWQAFRKERE